MLHCTVDGLRHIKACQMSDAFDKGSGAVICFYGATIWFMRHWLRLQLQGHHLHERDTTIPNLHFHTGP